MVKALAELSAPERRPGMLGLLEVDARITAFIHRQKVDNTRWTSYSRALKSVAAASGEILCVVRLELAAAPAFATHSFLEQHRPSLLCSDAYTPVLSVGRDSVVNTYSRRQS